MGKKKTGKNLPHMELFDMKSSKMVLFDIVGFVFNTDSSRPYTIFNSEGCETLNGKNSTVTVQYNHQNTLGSQRLQ
jgi:hypothetical protein